ncbi:MAG: hypothetical protein GY822_01805 [Deltaproteobacteria bacterium]|nr:hypothetical protein [Deltaproteobacteria bacterium]
MRVFLLITSLLFSASAIAQSDPASPDDELDAPSNSPPAMSDESTEELDGIDDPINDDTNSSEEPADPSDEGDDDNQSDGQQDVQQDRSGDSDDGYDDERGTIPEADKVDAPYPDDVLYPANDLGERRILRSQTFRVGGSSRRLVICAFYQCIFH